MLSVCLRSGSIVSRIHTCKNSIHLTKPNFNNFFKIPFQPQFLFYLHNPSGIISKWLLAAEKTCKDDSLPIPDGIPLKFNWLSFKYNLRSEEILHNEVGSAVSLFLHKFRVSSFCKSSENEQIALEHHLLSFNLSFSQQKKNFEPYQSLLISLRYRYHSDLADVDLATNKVRLAPAVNCSERNQVPAGSWGFLNSPECCWACVVCRAFARSSNSSTMEVV